MLRHWQFAEVSQGLDLERTVFVATRRATSDQNVAQLFKKYCANPVVRLGEGAELEGDMEVWGVARAHT